MRARAPQYEMIGLDRPGAPVGFSFTWEGMCNAGWGTYNQNPRVHPNQKPVELMVFIIQQSGVAAESPVLDPYMGGGSTGVAALALGRLFIGIESHDEYFETACARIQEAVDKQWAVETSDTRLRHGGNTTRERKLRKYCPELAAQVDANTLTLSQAYPSSDQLEILTLLWLELLPQSWCHVLVEAFVVFYTNQYHRFQGTGI